MGAMPMGLLGFLGDKGGAPRLTVRLWRGAYDR